MKTRRSLFCAGFVSALILISAALHADGFIIVPRPPRPGPASPFPLEVTRHDVRVEIDGQLATTTVDQEFFNPNASRLEGYYLFPLPSGAVIKDFSMWIDGEETRAELLDAARARGIYEDIVRRLRDPALLEYDGRGVFKVRIFPIEPRSTKRIRISYHEVLDMDNGGIAYLYPLGTEKLSARTIPEVSVVVNIHSPTALAAVHCPTHPVTIARPAPGRATVRYSARDTLPDSDFRLFITPAAGRIAFSLLAFRPEAQEGTFFLSVVPDAHDNRGVIAAKDITFVVDTSGSMAGRAMEQARSAIAYCLDRLRRQDRFNVVRFATEAEALFPETLAAAPSNIARAKEFVSNWQAAGGTNCEEALKLALNEKAAPGRSRLVVLVTDGRPTIGETGDDALLRLVAKAGAEGHGVRIFPVAIGSEINTHLLDRIAERTRTFRTYIAVGEEIESGISRFFDKIGSPVLCDVRLRISGNVRASRMHPGEIPDLYLGSTLTVIGRYQGSGAATVTLSGLVNGRTEEYHFKADFPAASLDHDFLPPLWAARRVGFLLDQIRLHGEDRELVVEVTRLARQYGIVTPYTSYLIVEDEKVRRDRGDLAESDMTLGRGVAAAPAMARQQREEFAGLRDKSGLGSVRASSELQKLNQAQELSETRPADDRLPGRQRQMRTVRGLAYYWNDGTWVDARIQGALQLPVTRLAFASADYFDLLKKRPELAAVLALGRNVRFLSHDRVIEISAPEKSGE